MARLIFLAAIGVIGYQIYQGEFSLNPKASGPGRPAGAAPAQGVQGTPNQAGSIQGDSGQGGTIQSVSATKRKNVILFTGTTWCPACQVLEKQIVGTSSWREFVRREVNYTVYDVPRDPQRTTQKLTEAVRRYRVQSFPTMLIVDDQGRVLSQRVGVAGDLNEYKRWIRSS